MSARAFWRCPRVRNGRNLPCICRHRRPLRPAGEPEAVGRTERCRHATPLIAPFTPAEDGTTNQHHAYIAPQRQRVPFRRPLNHSRPRSRRSTNPGHRPITGGHASSGLARRPPSRLPRGRGPALRKRPPQWTPLSRRRYCNACGLWLWGCAVPRTHHRDLPLPRVPSAWACPRPGPQPDRQVWPPVITCSTQARPVSVEGAWRGPSR